MKSTLTAGALVATGLTLGVTATPPGDGQTLAAIALVITGWATYVLPRTVAR